MCVRRHVGVVQALCVRRGTRSTMVTRGHPLVQKQVPAPLCCLSPRTRWSHLFVPCADCIYSVGGMAGRTLTRSTSWYAPLCPPGREITGCTHTFSPFCRHVDTSRLSGSFTSTPSSTTRIPITHSPSSCWPPELVVIEMLLNCSCAECGVESGTDSIVNLLSGKGPSVVPLSIVHYLPIRALTAPTAMRCVTVLHSQCTSQYLHRADAGDWDLVRLHDPHK